MATDRESEHLYVVKVVVERMEPRAQKWMQRIESGTAASSDSETKKSVLLGSTWKVVVEVGDVHGSGVGASLSGECCGRMDGDENTEIDTDAEGRRQ